MSSSLVVYQRFWGPRCLHHQADDSELTDSCVKELKQEMKQTSFEQSHTNYVISIILRNWMKCLQTMS